MNQPRLHKQTFTLTDYFVISAGISLVLFLSVTQWQESHAADYAVVHNDRGEKITISLQDNHEHDIHGRLGDSLLEVKDGKIRFKHSSCKQRICVQAGWLAEGGEAAACLPNGISVVLHSDSARYDSINF